MCEDVKLMLNKIRQVWRRYLPSFLGYWESSLRGGRYMPFLPNDAFFVNTFAQWRVNAGHFRLVKRNLL